MRHHTTPPTPGEGHWDFRALSSSKDAASRFPGIGASKYTPTTLDGVLPDPSPSPRARRVMLANQYKQWGSFISVPPPGYLPPSTDQIKSKLKDISGFSIGFVRELCNLAAGGRFSSPSLWQPIVKHIASKNVSQAEGETPGSKERRIREGIYTMAQFLKSIDFAKVPGSSPLEKATWIIKSLQQGNFAADLSGSGGVTLPITTPGGKSTWNKYEQLYDDFNQMDDIDFALILANTRREAKEGSALDQRAAVMECLLGDPIKRQMATIGRQLSEIDGVSVVPQITITPNAHGDDVRRRQLQSPQELPRIDKHQWALLERSPLLFWQRVMSREMYVRERVTRTDKKQLLYLLIDCSGSMRDDGGKRIGAACGVLMNRLRAVIEGKAELFYRFFDGSVHQERHVKNRQDALKAMSEVLNTNFSGGSTDINGAVRAGQESIENLVKTGKFHRPHIVVVTDGGDSIHLSAENIKGTTLHAVLCMCNNSVLTKLAQTSGGLALWIKDDKIEMGN